MKRLIHMLMSIPLVYRVWQRTHDGEKLAYFRDRISWHDVVLDLGCGPGTLAGALPATYWDRGEAPRYYGVDCSESYIRTAAKRFPRGHFTVADVRGPLPPCAPTVVCLNSLMHHLSDDEAALVLRAAAQFGVRILVLDLVLPTQRWAGWLARHDRGEYPRPLPQWMRLFRLIGEVTTCGSVYIRRGGVLWYHLIGAEIMPRLSGKG